MSKEEISNAAERDLKMDTGDFNRRVPKGFCEARVYTFTVILSPCFGRRTSRNASDANVLSRLFWPRKLVFMVGKAKEPLLRQRAGTQHSSSTHCWRSFAQNRGSR